MKKLREKTPAAGAPALPLQLLFLLAPFAAGGYYEPVSALFSLLLLGYLAWLARRDGGLSLPKDLLLASTAALVLFYAVSPLWATDRGMAILGFVKFLPLPLFVIACGQLTAEQRRDTLALLPWGGAAMMLLSGALALLSAASGFVLAGGRLAGFFQYPNTFAQYVLLGAAVLLGREEWRPRETACLVILLAGVALSGSRTVMALLAALVVIFWIVSRDKKRCLILTAAAAAALAGGFLLSGLLLSGRTDAVSAAGRALAGGAGTSTFWGRLLYFRDALPVILRHPLGLGYLGYYFRQGSFQTGVYSVVHIHNDLLQFLLDVGWIPAGLLTWAVARRFLDRGCGRTRRLVIGLAVIHALFDFDLQFTAMDLILLLALMPEGGKTIRLRRGGAWTGSVLLAALCLYFGTASALCYLDADAAAASVYPGYTMAWLDRMSDTDDPAEMDRAADEILARNDFVSLAHSAKARIAFSQGDISGMIAEKRRAIALAKYDLSTYLDYFDMLAASLQLYAAAGDADSAAYCRERLLEIPTLLQDVLDGTSALGWRITDQPELTLPEEYIAALDALR